MPPTQKTISRAYWGLALCAIAAYIARHIAAGFALPVPWPDESSFLWQAIGVQRGWTLFAPELNLAREIMWMPPGYMLCIGLLYDVVGVSLEAARTFSLVCMIGTFGFFAATLRRHPYPLLSIIALGAVFYSAPLVVTGNVARMDSLVLFVAAAAIYCFDRKYDTAGLGLVAVSPLIHPGAANLCLAAAAYLLTSGRWKHLRFSRGVIAAIVVVVVAWGFFGVHVLNHWVDFQADISYQFLLRKIKPRPLFDFPNVIFLIVFVCTVIVGAIRGFKYLVLTWFGIGLWCMYMLGMEAWYECYCVIGMLMMMMVMIPIVIAATPTLFARWTPARRHAITALTLVAVVAIGYRAYSYQLFQSDNGSGGWHGMRVEDHGVPYIDSADRSRVTEFLSELQKRGTTVFVQFFPEADAIFYADRETSTLRFCQGAFYNFAADVYVVHTSRYVPAWWMKDMQRKFNAMGMLDTSKVKMLVRRDSTESVAAFAYPWGQAYRKK